ncbi:MAG: hypothetical protein IJ165_05355 [Proteobacteria bacterium]|nr:hypothetical protein [Pseudomonadota bacterium]
MDMIVPSEVHLSEVFACFRYFDQIEFAQQTAYDADMAERGAREITHQFKLGAPVTAQLDGIFHQSDLYAGRIDGHG